MDGSAERRPTAYRLPLTGPFPAVQRCFSSSNAPWSR